MAPKAAAAAAAAAAAGASPKGKGKGKGSAKGHSALQIKSPAEFFAENKGIAGFDNPGKSLFTTIREFVENSLDAAESVRTPPDISVTIEEVKLDGRFAGAAQKALAADGDDGGKQNKTGAGYYRVTVKDNGCGMAHDDIPNMFGRVLAGTKYSVKQNRGRFGLGAKMALLWAKMSSGEPLTVRSSRRKSGPITLCILDIDINKNVPRIIKHELVPNTEEWVGSEISVVIGGAWSSYKAKILSYMRQLAVITPYAKFQLRFSALDTSKSFVVLYSRRTEYLPEPPREVKHHPSSVDLIVLKRLTSEAAERGWSVKKTLMTQFSSISSKQAEDICDRLGVDPQEDMADLSELQIKRIRDIFHDVSFPPPDGSCLSPAGEYNLRLGIMKELKPDMVATWQDQPQVFEGHPFIVEAGVSLGGKTAQPGITIYRFANRIPLLFEAGADVVTRTAMSKIKYEEDGHAMRWVSYKINKNTDKVGVFVSIVSTKVPFKGTGKEYIGDDAEAIAEAVKRALQQCCQQLRVKLRHGAALKERQERRQNLTKYIPNVANAVFSVLMSSVDENPAKRIKLSDNSCVEVSDRARTELPIPELLHKVKTNDITASTLRKKLETHVEQANFMNAFESTAHGSGNRQRMDNFFISPLQASPELAGVRHPVLDISAFAQAVVGS